MHERTVGVIGLGIMGSAGSGNLLKDGFEVIGYDVLSERVRALEARGGRGVTAARAVGASGDHPAAKRTCARGGRLRRAWTGQDGAGGSGAARVLYAAAQGQGRAKEDTAAVCAVLEEMAGLRRSQHD